MVELLDNNLSLPYVSVGADHPIGFYLNVNLSSSKIKRSGSLDYLYAGVQA